MHFGRVVRVETESHRAEGNGVQRKPRKIVRNGDRMLWTVSRPFHAQLCRDVMHIIEHTPDRHRAKRGHQDPVSNTPIGLVGPSL